MRLPTGRGRAGPASGQREHGDGRTVVTQTATQVPLTSSRPFLFQFGATDSRHDLDTSRQSQPGWPWPLGPS